MGDPTNTNMTMYSNQMSSAWKNRIAKENLKVLEGLNMVPKQSSRRDESGRRDTNTPAHHSAPFACDIVPNNKNNNNNNNNNRSRQSTSRSSRPSTSATRPGTCASRPSTSASRQSCDSFASGRPSHRADQADWNQQSSRTAGLGAEHEVLKKMANLEEQAKRKENENLQNQLTAFVQHSVHSASTSRQA